MMESFWPILDKLLIAMFYPFSPSDKNPLVKQVLTLTLAPLRECSDT